MLAHALVLPRILAVIALLLSTALVAVAAQEGEADREDGARASVRRALLVGCGDYPYLRERDPRAYEASIRLRGPEHDVALVREVLLGTLGFDAREVETLVGWPEEADRRPTRARILAGLDELAQRSGDGDLVLVYFAGHGAQQPARDDRGEPDGLDEVLLAADARRLDGGRGTIPGAITDDELGARLVAIRDRGARVWLVVDACHSGSMLRASDAVRPRGLELEQLGIDEDALPAFRRRRRAPDPPVDFDERGIVAYYGAQSYGRAPETLVDTGEGERWHGLFTWLLAAELERTHGHATFDELVARVIAAYQAWPYHGTVPGVSGADRDTFLLDGVRDEERLVARVSSAPAAVGGSARWTLDRGRLAGVVLGCVVEVLDDDGEIRTVFEVDRATPFSASGPATASEAADPSRAWRARVASIPFEGLALSWALVDEDGAELELDGLGAYAASRLGDEVFASRYPRVAPDRAAWRVVASHDGFVLRPAPRTGGFDLFVEDASALPAAIAGIARSRNLLAAVASDAVAPLPASIALRVEVRGGPNERARVLRAGERVEPGHELRVVLEKAAGAIVDLNLFFADAHHGLTRLFPRAGDDPRLGPDAAGEIELLRWTSVLDTSIGVEHLVAFAQERGASDPAFDLASLAQEQVGTLRSSASDPVIAFLEDLARAQPTRSAPAVHLDAPVGAAVVTLDVGWSGVVPPAWPDDGPRELDASLSVPAGWAPPEAAPNPYALGTHGAALRVLAGANAPPMALLGGDEQGVRRVLLDLRPPAERPPVAEGGEAVTALVANADAFVPDAAFVFEGRARYAYYRGRTSRAFDLVLVDRDGDAVADERWRRDGTGSWRHETGVAVPWSSQAWLGGLRKKSDRERAAEAFGVLSPK